MAVTVRASLKCLAGLGALKLARRGGRCYLGLSTWLSLARRRQPA
jgi:hypothetical protein